MKELWLRPHTQLNHNSCHCSLFSKDVKYSQESLSCELSKLTAEKLQSEQRVKDLEDDVKVLTDRETEGSMELERQVRDITFVLLDPSGALDPTN